MKKLIISRKDLKNNLKVIRKILNAPGKDDFGNVPKIIAVVKGNGMGLGLIEYSKFLVNNGINYLAVANIEEALNLRQAGIKESIFMLTPIVNEKEIQKMIENDVIFTIGSTYEIEMIEKVANDLNKDVQAHLKIDTGFARYGFLYSNTNEIIKAFKMCDKLKIVGTYTHFARPLDEKFTYIQFNRFMNVIKILKQNDLDAGMLHVSESTAFLKYPIMNLNAVRIGSLLQGRTMVPNKDLIKIGEFKSSIVEIKTVPKGYNISYGDMFKTKRETKIAILPVGYIDGLNMKKDRDIFSFRENFLSVAIELKKFFKDNTIKVKIKDKKYNVIGRVGMYHIVIDITSGVDISIGDEAIFDIPPMLTNSMIRREYV